jgi:hypothetical protein
VKLEAARQFALSLPETTEQDHWGSPSWRVKGRIFSNVGSDEKHLHVYVGADETHAAVAEDPAAYEELWWGKKLSGVRVYLPKAKVARVRELLEESWRMRAPKRVVTEWDAGR